MARWTNTTQHHPFTIGPHLYLFQTSHILSSICPSKTSHSLFQAASRKIPCLLAKHPPMCLLQQKHPLITQFPEKHHMTQLSLQRNHEFSTSLVSERVVSRPNHWAVCLHLEFVFKKPTINNKQPFTYRPPWSLSLLLLFSHGHSVLL